MADGSATGDGDLVDEVTGNSWLKVSVCDCPRRPRPDLLVNQAERIYWAAVRRQERSDRGFVLILQSDHDPMIPKGASVVWGRFILFARIGSYPSLSTIQGGVTRVDGWVLECDLDGRFIANAPCFRGD